ncbi:MAG: DUF167 family protein [Thermoproteota archaeon]|jgi:uncharacterized protein (TIGR00251 family)|nr:DUF167 family protein [Thermoproteota archaeon]NLD66223.1 DUF167 domain-containing protein [Thermoproteota archaeon]
MKINETKDGTTISIFVKPNSPKFKIEYDHEDIIVHSTEEPVKGKVNKEIIKEVGKLLGSKVEIISGLTSKQKVLLIINADKTDVEHTLKRAV